MAAASSEEQRPLIEAKARELRAQIKQYERQNKLSIALESEQLDESFTLFGIAAMIYSFISPMLQGSAAHSGAKRLAEIVKDEFVARGWSEDQVDDEHIRIVLEDIRTGKVDVRAKYPSGKIKNAVVKAAHKVLQAMLRTGLGRALNASTVKNYIRDRDYGMRSLPADPKKRDEIAGYIEYARQSGQSDEHIMFDLGLKKMYFDALMKDYPSKRKPAPMDRAAANEFRASIGMPELQESVRPIWEIPLSKEALMEIRMSARLSPVQAIQNLWATIREFKDRGLALNARNMIYSLWAMWQRMSKYAGNSEETDEIIKAITEKKKVLDIHLAIIKGYKQFMGKSKHADTVAGAFAYLVSSRFEGVDTHFTYDQVMKMSFTTSKSGMQVLGDIAGAVGIKNNLSAPGKSNRGREMSIGELLKTQEGAIAFLDTDIGTFEMRQMLKTDQLIGVTIELAQRTAQRYIAKKQAEKGGGQQDQQPQQPQPNQAGQQDHQEQFQPGEGSQGSGPAVNESIDRRIADADARDRVREVLGALSAQ